tara:strand:+ start:59 stop:328 length:270 start_codon:yes stop_codon:yes gene_type:complete
MSQPNNIKDCFEKSIQQVKNLDNNKKPSDDILLRLYGLYKQITLGNINTNKPSIFNYKLLKKWESWNECKDMETEKAQQKYIDIVNSFI